MIKEYVENPLISFQRVDKKNTVMKIRLMIFLIFCVVFSACKKEELITDDTEIENNTNTNPTAALVFEKLKFNNKIAYFSTDGSMSEPVDSNLAKNIVGKIDITFIYDYDYSEPGFFDPIARSKEWYWNTFHLPWLNDAVETQYYSTDLSKDQFEEAKSNQSKIGIYFSDNASFVLAPHAIFPYRQLHRWRTISQSAVSSFEKRQGFRIQKYSFRKKRFDSHQT